MSSDESKTSSKKSITLLNTLPTIAMDKFLLTPYADDKKVREQKRITVPLNFAIPMMILREKHEVELKNGKSFIEQDPPPKDIVEELAERILLNCTSEDDIEAIFGRAKPIVIFHTILEMIKHLSEPLFTLTPKAAKITSNSLLLQPVPPYDYVICDELYETILRHKTEMGEESTARFKRSKPKVDVIVKPLVQKYYLCEGLSAKKTTKIRNRFNKCIYHDLHVITSPVQRNLVRFLIRNFIHIARRYNVVFLNRLRAQRSERWQITKITTAPHIVEYCYTRIADSVGPVLISQSGFPEYYENVEKRAMLNILAAGMDRLWLPGQKPTDVIVNTEPAYCHSNCVCGRGLNVTKAET